MIISNSKKFIFVHIHKCAGTSVTHALEPLSKWNDIELGGTKYGELIQKPYHDKFGLNKHSPAHKIKEIVGDETWNDYYTFSFVRSPFSRVVSLYTYIKEKVQYRQKRIYRTLGLELLHKADFKSWELTRVYNETDDFQSFIRHDDYINAGGAQPLFDNLADKDKNKVIVDYVGRVEDIDNSIHNILTTIGEKPKRMPFKNVSNTQGNFEKYYLSDQDYQHVYNLYKKDFEVFGYEAPECCK